MYVTREQQIQILHAINNEKEITNELIRKLNNNAIVRLFKRH